MAAPIRNPHRHGTSHPRVSHLSRLQRRLRSNRKYDSCEMHRMAAGEDESGAARRTPAAAGSHPPGNARRQRKATGYSTP
jgi:hypothetical protein